MPLYTWTNPEGEEVLVLRTFEDYEMPPSEDETELEGPWERVIGKGIRTIRGPGWNGAKGYW